MKFFRLKLWLARRSKRLDEKFTEQFWKEYREMIQRTCSNLDLDTKDIKFIKNNEKETNI
jgi:hypothetical protein